MRGEAAVAGGEVLGEAAGPRHAQGEHDVGLHDVEGVGLDERAHPGGVVEHLPRGDPQAGVVGAQQPVAGHVRVGQRLLDPARARTRRAGARAGGSPRARLRAGCRPGMRQAWFRSTRTSSRSPTAVADGGHRRHAELRVARVDPDLDGPETPGRPARPRPRPASRAAAPSTTTRTPATGRRRRRTAPTPAAPRPGPRMSHSATSSGQNRPPWNAIDSIRRTWGSIASGSVPRKWSTCGAKPAMVSPEPMPTTPSSVSTRTTVAAKRRRGSGSHAACMGGSRAISCSVTRMAVIFTAVPRSRGAAARGGPGPAAGALRTRRACGERKAPGELGRWRPGRGRGATSTCWRRSPRPRPSPRVSASPGWRR